ncbi:MAG: succinyldiaminopimelate transaminase [Pseudomonadota bacterium]|jgi:N-succinyldiaminopimelate aminotransferase|nr:succinyldiaminopimelate transaminase [Pseudomonadota bacterium]
MNKELKKLQTYPFQKLTALLERTSTTSKDRTIALTIGEPKHSPPDFVLEFFQDSSKLSAALGSYPATRGLKSLRDSVAKFLVKRYDLRTPIDSERQILPVNGTREALFAIAQCVLSKKSTGLVLMPNPFYQIYEGAGILAGSNPYFLNCFEDTNFQPNFEEVDASTWTKCELLYICTPGNPSGAAISLETMKHLIQLSDEHNFVIVSDECYSEIYHTESSPPPGILQACDKLNRGSYKNCLVFNSLSKRSNLPGLRSGFVAGDAKLIENFLLYRTYHGSAMPLHHQFVSALAWADEDHVVKNRSLYREKVSEVIKILETVLSVPRPECGFFLWPKTPGSDTQFSINLYEQTNTKVLPGSFLSRDTFAGNPGKNRVRLALVQPLEECIEAARRIKNFMNNS